MEQKIGNKKSEIQAKSFRDDSKNDEIVVKLSKKIKNLNTIKNENLITIKNEANVFEEGKSTLQDNFKRFLIKRKELKKAKQQEISRPVSFRDNPERIEALRNKFIKKALSYLGVPYGKRFLTEDNPLYHSPIFLDCCGLVRQCVNDLKEEFGFMLGRWNQAYEFDILPEEIPFEQMKMGDLIFYTATYYKEKNWKSQPHDMVHVEIFLGGKSGEETVGARERFGVVEINESFKFTSENYYDIKYHFKSIDTWLRGIYKSFCNEHKWHDALLEENVNNKYSLFKIERNRIEEYNCQIDNAEEKIN